MTETGNISGTVMYRPLGRGHWIRLSQPHAVRRIANVGSDFGGELWLVRDILRD
jgi:hypothetical protein